MKAEAKATFAEHIRELRSRLMWSLLFVAIGAGIGYALNDTLLNVLQRPLNETLYYTNPTGAFSFIIKICTVFGLIVALPMTLYQGFSFFEPLINVRTRRTIVLYVLLSALLAVAGIAFAYFISLPAALHFLVNFGNGTPIESLITANEYFNFVLAYIAGFAVLFQLPLIITFINRVTPLTPSKLMGGTRYVVLGSFIMAAIITPTPDPFNQALMAGPIILLYFLSALVVALINWRSARAKRAPEPKLVTESVLDELAAEKPGLAPVPRREPVTRPALAPAPRPLYAAPSTQQNRPPRIVTDMIVPARRAPVQAYQPRPQVPVQPARVHRPGRLISDFIPATE